MHGGNMKLISCQLDSVRFLNVGNVNVLMINKLP